MRCCQPPFLAIAIAVAITALAALQARAEDSLLIDGQIGPAFLMRSLSHAVGHAFKAAARLGLRRSLGGRIEVGGALSGLLDGSAHYRVVGALSHGRVALWRRPAFSLGAGLGLGVGLNADILHGDLRAGASPMMPYGFLSLDARWAIAGRWLSAPRRAGRTCQSFVSERSWRFSFEQGER